VRLEPGSRIAETVGTTELEVNSFHHQAIDVLGDRLRPTGWSEDGLIEAIEATDRDFVIGVQWHAEGLLDAVEQHALFNAFTAECSRPRRRTRRSRAA
jgi:putative glutamine amidotransferase